MAHQNTMQSDEGAIVSDLAGKAAHFSNLFDEKQYMNVIDYPVYCYLMENLFTFVYSSRYVRKLLSELVLNVELNWQDLFLGFSRN